jgi:hypothetical protein
MNSVEMSEARAIILKLLVPDKIMMLPYVQLLDGEVSQHQLLWQK